MRRSALPLISLCLVSCAPAQEAGERLALERSAFTSAHATLLDFELDGTLVAETPDPDTLRAQIDAQLLFTVGALNADGSVGQLGQLEVSNVDATLIPEPPPPPPVDPAPAPVPPAPPRYAVRYHARFPVAWGGGAAPTTYSFALPAKLAAADQLAFAAKYGATCVDPTAGPVDPGSMFLFFRPAQPGCTLAADDVARFDATVSPSAENTHGKYPEYHRVWADDALEIVAMFSHEYTTPTPGDEGVSAYNDFVWRTLLYLRELQPDVALQSVPAAPYATGDGPASVRLAAELPDGRTIAVDVRLVGHALADDGAAFDAWYDPLTPNADLILYNGHAGLGANVRTLMTKGTFVPNHYVIWFANGCDTFAYVDRTLVDRRALLNADDPGGTKYMDTLANVMAGHFKSLEPTSLTLVHALVEARDTTRPPKTYEEIFQGIDPSQIVVVTGEEDNVLEPLPPPPRPAGVGHSPGTSAGPSAATTSPPGADGAAPGNAAAAAVAVAARGSDGCSVAYGVGARERTSSTFVALGIAAGMLARRRRRTHAAPRVSAVSAFRSVVRTKVRKASTFS